MKILVPTDFSENSAASSRYAAHLGKSLDATVVFVHVYDLVSSVGIYERSKDIVHQRLQEEMADLIRGLEKSIGFGFAYDTLLLTGNPASAIASIAEDYDFLVMSAKGQVDLDRIFLGSTTRNVIQQTNCSVLVVPPFYRFQPIETIIFAIDQHGINTAGLLVPLPQIARHFGARIEVFHLDEGDNEKGFQLDLDIFLEEIPHSIHYDFGKNNLVESIHNFVDEEQAELLCLIHRHRTGFFNKLFQNSTTFASLSRSKVPLLVLQESAR